MKSSLIESFRSNERWTSITSHIILVLMMACIGIGILRFGAYIFPGWNTNGLIVVSILVSIEAIFSLRVFKKLPEYIWNVLSYYLIEWVIIAFIIKIFTEIRFGMAYFWDNLIDWPKHYLLAFFTIDFMINMGFVFFIWLITILFAGNLSELEGDEALLRSQGEPVDRRTVHKKILSRFLGMGILVITLAGAMRQDRLTLFNHSSISSTDLSFVFYYFLLGLILLSLTNFASLRATWSLEHITLQKNLAARWIFSSIIFLAALTGLSVILPTRYTMGLLDIVGYLLNFLAYVFQLIFAVIMVIYAVIANIIDAIIRFLFGEPQDIQASTQNPLQQVVQNAGAQMNTLTFMEVVKSLLFWSVLIFVVAFAVYQYMDRNREFFIKISQLKILKWLVYIWNWLRGFWEQTGENIRTAVRTGIDKLKIRRKKGKTKTGWNLIHLRRLTPRQQVLFYYHAFLRRADQTGLPRSPWMTPYEYSETIERDMFEEEENITSLTDGFIEARYSRHEVEKDFAGRIKNSWERLRNYLRSRRGFSKHP